GFPYQYSIEGDVEDVSRQHIAGSASFTVHPAPWYVGVKRPSLFVEQKEGFNTSIVAAAPDGTPKAGVQVAVSLVQVQWHSVRRARTAADIPNLLVSVLLVKGRTKADAPAGDAGGAGGPGGPGGPGDVDSSDPGKPSFRIGYAKLNVEDASKRLSVTVKANKD